MENTKDKDMSSENKTIETGPPHVHHMDAKTAYQSAKLGMWLFLATEILLFGGLFTAFAIYRYLYLEEFTQAAMNLDWRMGAINTAILIFSSFTAAIAVDAAQHGDNKRVRKNVLITLICGVGFLVIKFFEYKGKAHHGIFPGGAENFSLIIFLGAILIAGAAFTIAACHKYKVKLVGVCSVLLVVAFYFISDSLSHMEFDLATLIPFGGKEALDVHHAVSTVDYSEIFKKSDDYSAFFGHRVFFGLYYCMTGLHALHVILGMGLLFWVFIKAETNRFSTDYYTPVEVGALYWHLVDLIWIYLFPLLYLVA